VIKAGALTILLVADSVAIALVHGVTHVLNSPAINVVGVNVSFVSQTLELVHLDVIVDYSFARIIVAVRYEVSGLGNAHKSKVAGLSVVSTDLFVAIFVEEKGFSILVPKFVVEVKQLRHPCQLILISILHVVLANLDDKGNIWAFIDEEIVVLGVVHDFVA